MPIYNATAADSEHLVVLASALSLHRRRNDSEHIAMKPVRHSDSYIATRELPCETPTQTTRFMTTLASQ